MLGFGAFACGILFSSVYAFQDITIATYLQNNAQFSTLSSLLKASGLDAALNGSGPFTLFAPTNQAFSLLTTSQLNELTANSLKLEAVLKYHVLSGFVLGPQIKDGMTKTTSEGETLQFHILANKTTKVEGATVSKVDEILNNGVVHTIDNVLLPSTSTLAEILLSRPNDFGDLILLLTITDLLPAISGPGAYTVFAPTNAAFEKVYNLFPSFESPNAMYIYTEVVKAHVINGTYMAADLQNGATVTTLHNNVITLDTTAGVKLLPSGAKVQIPDIEGINGVIHAIDSVMIPSDL